MNKQSMMWSLALVAVLAGCGKGHDANREALAAQQSKARALFIAETTRWRALREQQLLAEDGWTSLVGLHWLGPGAHFIGSGPGSGIRLAAGPARLGMIVLKQGRVHLTPEAGTDLSLNGLPFKAREELQTDQGLLQSVVGFEGGKGTLSVIKRGDRYALRVKHADAPSRLGFAGLQYWDTNPAWRVVGKFVANPEGKTLQIADIVGTISQLPNPGAVEFERDGKTYRVEALSGGDGELFFVFADRTSGHGSYPAGRYLDTTLADAQGQVVLDFNRAYNPPCAFTSYATCPLPPPENRLDLRVDAGEKVYVPNQEVSSKES